MPSKLSVHDLVPNGEAPLLIDAGCTVVKSVDDAGLILEAMSRNPNPGAIFIMRFNDPQLSVEQARKDGLSPLDAVLRWWNAYEAKIILNPHLKNPRVFLEGYNEPVWKKTNPSGGPDLDDITGMAYYGMVEKLRVEFLAARGYRACIGNFSVGYPRISATDISWWIAFEPAIDAAIANGGILGMHCYSWRDLPGDQSNSNRQQMVWDFYLSTRNKHIGVVITEFGLLYPNDSPAVSDDEYFGQLVAADSWMRSQPWLIGATIFAFGDTGAWPAFRISRGLAELIAAHIRAVKDLPVPPPPTPPAPTLPPPAQFWEIGDRVKVDPAKATALNVRNDPSGNPLVIGAPKGTQPANAEGAVTGMAFSALLNGNVVGWISVNWDSGVDGIVSQSYLARAPIIVVPPPPPPSTPIGVNLLVNPDMLSGGTHTLPDKNNVRIGDGWWLHMHEGWEPRLEDMSTDPNSVWLAVEAKFLTRLGGQFSEPTPPSEWHQYFEDGGDTEVVQHIFKGWGIQWWELGQDIILPAGVYDWSLSLYPDIYFRNHQFVTNDGRAGEWRLNVKGLPDLAWDNGNTPPLGQDERVLFGHWRRLSRRFTHPGGSTSVSMEFRARWGVDTVGAMLKLTDLRRVS